MRKLTTAILFISLLCACTKQQPTTSIEVVNRPNGVRNNHYVNNREPLKPELFIKLPVGKVKPEGWVKRYLELQRDGLTGKLGEISAWLNKENNAWLNEGGEWGWEEVPYWLKGYGNLAYILEDSNMIDEAKIWIEAAINSQTDDGYFGPINLRNGNRELWANMIMLWCLQSYYEYSGDNRVIDLMTRYFKWQMTVPDEAFLKDYWEHLRVADNIYSIYWLYNITGDGFLLDLAEKVHHAGADWTQEDSNPNWHNVNIAQGFREPATYYMLSGDSAHLHATYKSFNLIRRTFGQVPGGMFGADENARMGYIDPRQGTETCGFVEQMSSDEMLLRYTGDPFWAEHCEDVAFNSYPAAVMPDFKSLRYITSPNQVVSDSKNHKPGIDNAGPFLAMNPFSSRCCQHNHAQGWPYFAENLILASADNGVAAAIYSACKAEVKVGDGEGVLVNITEETNYPFEENIKFTFNTPQSVKFPFYLRIPTWAKNPTIMVNGQKVGTKIENGKYLRIDRTWENGDKVEITFPMTLTYRQWQVNQNSVSVNYGPLTLSLKIDEEYKKVDSKESAIWDSKWQATADPSQWPSYEIYPQSAWNYALILNEKDYFTDFSITKKAWPDDNYPFTLESCPIEVQAYGRKISSWTIDKHGLCGVLPQTDSKKSDVKEKIQLIPMGAARLRIASFPVSIE